MSCILCGATPLTNHEIENYNGFCRDCYEEQQEGMEFNNIINESSSDFYKNKKEESEIIELKKDFNSIMLNCLTPVDIEKLKSSQNWDKYFMDIVNLVSKRSTCLRRSVGAAIVKDRHILSTGYNGAPSNIKHCSETGCLRGKMSVPSGEKHELCRGVHAEQNAIIQAAYHGVSIKDATLFCTNLPCSICAKMIINAGIIRIVYKSEYLDQLSTEMLTEANIELIKL